MLGFFKAKILFSCTKCSVQTPECFLLVLPSSAMFVFNLLAFKNLFIFYLFISSHTAQQI